MCDIDWGDDLTFCASSGMRVRHFDAFKRPPLMPTLDPNVLRQSIRAHRMNGSNRIESKAIQQFGVDLHHHHRRHHCHQQEQHQLKSEKERKQEKWSLHRIDYLHASNTTTIIEQININQTRKEMAGDRHRYLMFAGIVGVVDDAAKLIFKCFIEWMIFTSLVD